MNILIDNQFWNWFIHPETPAYTCICGTVLRGLACDFQTPKFRQRVPPSTTCCVCTNSIAGDSIITKDQTEHDCAPPILIQRVARIRHFWCCDLWYAMNLCSGWLLRFTCSRKYAIKKDIPCYLFPHLGAIKVYHQKNKGSSRHSKKY